MITLKKNMTTFEQKQKNNLKHKKWRLANPEKVLLRNRKSSEKIKAKDPILYPKSLKAQAKHRDKTKSIFANLKKEQGNKCCMCGYNKHPEILHFHHSDTKTKTGEVSVIIRTNIKKGIEEAKKCILLCPNCHALKHLDEHEKKRG